MPFFKVSQNFHAAKIWLKEKLTVWFLYRFSVNRVKKRSPFCARFVKNCRRRTSVTTKDAGCAVEHGPMKPCLRFCPDGVGSSKQLTKNNKKWGDDCWVVCFFVCLFGWLVGGLVGWLVGWSVCWLVVVGCCWLLLIERYSHHHVMFLMEEILHHLGCTEPCEN